MAQAEYDLFFGKSKSKDPRMSMLSTDSLYKYAYGQRMSDINRKLDILSKSSDQETRDRANELRSNIQKTKKIKLTTLNDLSGELDNHIKSLTQAPETPKPQQKDLLGTVLEFGKNFVKGATENTRTAIKQGYHSLNAAGAAGQGIVSSLADAALNGGRPSANTQQFNKIREQEAAKGLFSQKALQGNLAAASKDVLKTGVGVASEVAPLVTGTSLANMGLKEALAMGGKSVAANTVLQQGNKLMKGEKITPGSLAQDIAFSAAGEGAGYAGGKLVKALKGGTGEAAVNAAEVGSSKAGNKVVTDITKPKASGRAIADTVDLAPAPKSTKAWTTPEGKPVSGIDKIGEPTKDAAGAVEKIKAKMSDLYTKTIDRYNPLVKLGRQAGDEQSVQRALAGHYGAGSTANYHIDRELTPILRGVDDKNLRSLLVAQRDMELAGRGIKGSSAEAASKVMSDLESKLGKDGVAKLQQTADQLYEYQRNIFNQYLVKSGLFSKEEAARIMSQNQRYVPFKRVMDKVDESLGVIPGRQAASIGSRNMVQGIKGSDRQIIDPLQSIVENTYKLVGAAKRNEAASSIINLAPNLPKGLIKEVSKAGPEDTVMHAFQNGVKHTFAVPKDVAEAAKGLNEESMSTIIKILSAPTRVFRETATGLNPEFGPKNVARDLQTAFITNGVGPVQWAKSFAHYLTRNKGGEGQRIFDEFQKAGGVTSRISLDQPTLKKSVTEITKGNGTLIAHPIKLLESIAQASEQPTRLAVFEKALKEQAKNGVTGEDALRNAAMAAQEGTVNFARRGSATQSANAIYAFLNARVQGTDRILRSLKNDPVKTSARLGMVAMAPALSAYAYNRQFPEYFDPRVVSPSDKQNNFILMAPWLGKDRYLKIPKGDVGKLANPVEAFMEYADGKGDNKLSSEIGKTLAAFLPTQNIGDIVPTAVRPLVEDAVNKNFFTDTPIVPDYKKNFPAAKQDNSSTAAIYRQIGDMLGVSPARIQNMAQGYLTGFARIGENLSNPVVPSRFKSDKNDQGDSINRTPVVRGFAGGAKQSKEEYAMSLSKKIQAINFEQNDLKAGLNRGDISQAEYDKQNSGLEKKISDIEKQAEKGGYSQSLQDAIYKAKEASKQKAKATKAKKKQKDPNYGKRKSKLSF